MSRIDNYSGFYEKNGKFVNVTLDLDAIGSPDRYRMMFYAEQIQPPITLIDPTNWIHIPPPEFDITISPNSTDISQGEQRNVLVQIKSTTGFQPKINLYSNQKDVDLKFNPNVLPVPSYGATYSNLDIKE